MPLYELLRSDQPKPGAPSPRARPVPRAPEAPPPSPSRGAEDRKGEPGGGRVSIPVPTLYAAIALAVALGVALYATGYATGHRSATARAETEWRSRTTPPEPQPIEPGLVGSQPGAGVREPGPPGSSGSRGTEERTSGRTPGRGDSAARPPSGSTGGQQTRSDGSTADPFAPLGPNGPLAEDPRQPDNNYLAIASNIERQEALDALRFLDDAGVRAVALPLLDSSGRPTNNPPRYKLVATQLAVPSPRYRAMQAERARLQERLAQLTPAYRDAGGLVAFDQTVWEKYTGR